MRKSGHVVGWIVATVLLVYFASRVDGAKLREAIAGLDWPWVAAAIVANALILVSLAALWWTISPRAERPPYRIMLEINAMALALMNTLPFLGGHAAAVVLLVKRGGLSRPGALSVMALDQLGEGLAKVTIFAAVALAAPIPTWMRLSVGTVCIGVAVLLVALSVAAHRHGSIKPEGAVKLTHWTRARILAADWAERMETLRDGRQSLVAYLLAIGTKVAELAGLVAVQHAFGLQVSVGATVLVLAAVTIGAMLPVAPGNVGTYETGAIIAYQHVGLDAGTAMALALVSHACFMIPSVGIGYLQASWRGFRLRAEVLSASPPSHTAPDSARQ